MLPKEDTRPRKNLWAPGNYHCKCEQCCEPFVGDKRALICADCAYSETVGLNDGYGGFPSRAAYEAHYSNVRNYADEIPAMEAYTRESMEEEAGHDEEKKA